MKTITKDLWIPYPPSRNRANEMYVGNADGLCHVTIHFSDKEKEEAVGNVELIADAGNTANKCGLLPSELLKQRDDLLGLFSELTNHIQGVDYCNMVILKIPMSLSQRIGKTIQKATK